MQNGLPIRRELEKQVLDRTGRRVRNLNIELGSHGVVLRGRATTFYVKQLAQQGVRELLPDVGLENAIVVEEPACLAS